MVFAAKIVIVIGTSDCKGTGTPGGLVMFYFIDLGSGYMGENSLRYSLMISTLFYMFSTHQ